MEAEVDMDEFTQSPGIRNVSRIAFCQRSRRDTVLDCQPLRIGGHEVITRCRRGILLDNCCVAVGDVFQQKLADIGAFKIPGRFTAEDRIYRDLTANFRTDGGFKRIEISDSGRNQWTCPVAIKWNVAAERFPVELSHFR